MLLAERHREEKRRGMACKTATAAESTMTGYLMYGASASKDAVGEETLVLAL
jgi:hypothetical protein